VEDGRKSKGHFSIVRLPQYWYVACRSEDLGDKPIGRTIIDVPIVLFRSSGKVSALLDRCAHRNVPLTLGWCEGDRLICGYHGWEYDAEGSVQRVPALAGAQTGKARRVQSFPTIERQGLVWVSVAEDGAVRGEPFEVPHLSNPAYSSLRYHAKLDGTLHANLENILDVPHTAFLHRGLFRGGRQNSITAVVRRSLDRVEAEYIGEPRPSGWIGRILAPRGGTVEHWDRFILPAIAQVEYKLEDNNVVVTNLLTPVSDFETMLHTIVTYRLKLPHVMVKQVLEPLAKKVVGQDAQILKAQAETIKRFGGEQFVSTEVDLLGPHILRLLKQAERGELDDVASVPEQRVELKA
jgi:phenylpropionate dioxygenase-like ring-hydroxylating dioxygenase large terminal subunit